jgi:chaperonin cofactor prefoldin
MTGLKQMSEEALLMSIARRTVDVSSCQVRIKAIEQRCDQLRDEIEDMQAELRDRGYAA